MCGPIPHEEIASMTLAEYRREKLKREQITARALGVKPLGRTRAFLGATARTHELWVQEAQKAGG